MRESIGLDVYPELDYINLLQCLFKSSNVWLILDSFVKIYIYIEPKITHPMTIIWFKGFLKGGEI